MEKEFGTFTDPRDGEVYKTVKIAGKEWLAENLRFSVRGDRIPDESKKEYGHLYNVNALKKAIPVGWRLPTQKEMEELFALAKKENENVAAALFATSEEPCEWQKFPGGLDLLGMGLVAAGNWSSYAKVFDKQNETAFLWCTGNMGALSYVEAERYEGSYSIKFAKEVHFYSVRLVKDDAAGIVAKKNSAKKNAKTGPVSDKFGLWTDLRDGEVYKTVKIGDQVWMAENYRYNSEESKKPHNAKGTPKALGLVYTRRVANGTDLPVGWLVPKAKDFEKLIETTGGKLVENGFIPMGSGEERVNSATKEETLRTPELAILWEANGSLGWHDIWKWDGKSLKSGYIQLDNGKWNNNPLIPSPSYVQIRFIQKSKKFTPATLEDLAKHDEEMNKIED